MKNANTNRHKANKFESTQEENVLKIILNKLPDTTLRVNNQGQILAIYGSNIGQDNIASKENKGKNLSDILPIFIAKGLLFNIKKAVETQNIQIFEYVNTIANQTQYFEAHINHLNQEETTITLRNITPFKTTEKTLNDKINHFEQEKRVLEKYIDSNLQMENFAYIASHDLREPLRTMRNFGQLLDRNIRSKIDKKNQGYLDFIVDAANRMNQLIEDLLTYTRANTDPFERVAINITNLLSQVINDLHDKISEVNIQVTVKYVPITIYGSLTRIQQIFQNLIENAIKFHQKQADFTDKEPFIIISCQDTPSHWQFSIEDNGIGISKEFFTDIFSVFKTLHSREKYQGTGIGLALVQRIIQQHEGEIWVESEEGQGSTFHFTLLK